MTNDPVGNHHWSLAFIEDGAAYLFEDDSSPAESYSHTRATVELRVDGEPVAVCESGSGSARDVLLNVNQISNSDFSRGLDCWEVRPGERIKGLKAGVDLSEDTSIEGIPTGYLRARDASVPAELVYVDPVDGELMPVRAGRRFQASGYFATRRGRGELVVQFFDEAEHLLAESSQDAGEARGGRNLKRYARAVVTGVSPLDARFARLLVRKCPTSSDSDSSLFFTRLWFGYVDSDVSRSWDPAALDASVVSWLRRHGPTCRVSSVALPADCFDGKPHTVEAVERANGQQAAGSPQHIRDATVIRGCVQRLEGTSVVGWVEAPGDEQAPIAVTLFIDGVSVANALAVSSPGQRGFRLLIPADWLDGLPHRLTVRVTGSGKVLGELAEILPHVSTSWSILQQFGGADTPAWLAPAAAHRYENLRQWLIALPELDEGQAIDRLSRLGLTHEILARGVDAIRDFAPLTFPQVTDPVVSVIVPVHNHFPVTYACLAALSFAYNRAPFEVIVVDDGSTDETTTLPELIAGVTYIRSETAQGFVRACNLGASRARGEYLVFLNNDTEPTLRWLDELLFVFETFDEVGLAGSKLLYPNGRLQEAGGIVWNNGNPWNYGRNGNPQEPKYNYTRQVDYLSGASIMLPRQVWDAVGGFGEEFCPAYFEDTDLAFKVRAIGKRVIYAPLSVVYHHEGMSGGAGTEPAAKRFQEIHRPTFQRKWVDAYQANGDEGKDVDLIKDRNIQFRALVIDEQAPRPENDAGGYAAMQEIRLLQSLGCKVTFLPLNLAYLGAHTDMLQRLGVECLHAPFVPSLGDMLWQRGSEFDLVYIFRYTAARRIIDHVRQLAPRAKVFFSTIDLHFLRSLRGALAASDPAALQEALHVRDEELAVMRRVDVVLCYNATEQAVILSHNFDATRIVTAPWVVDVKDEVPPFAARQDVAFLGGFRHPPNLPAVKFFISEVMPLLRQRLPGVRFRVYGSHVPEELKKLASNDVLIDGYVEDIAEVYDTCRVFIAPLLAGAGLKGKVVDCLAHGTPSVLSPIAVEGMALRHGLETFVAETPTQWVTSIAALYEDPALWQAMSDRARAYARTAYSFQRGRELMSAAFEAAGLYPPHQPKSLVSRTARITI